MTDEQPPTGGQGTGAQGADLVREAMAKAKADARARAAASDRGARGAARAAAKDAERTSRPRGEPVAFGAALKDVLADRGWETQAAGASVLSRWPELVGEQVAAHCRPTRLRDGELVVEAESTAWATQLRLLSRTLQQKLRDELGPDVVRSLVVRGPSGPDWNHGRLRITGGRGPRDTYG
jgi:predicted nucleic acid-binding Zn ribbon protein